MIILATIIFAIGAVGVIARKNILVILMSVELMMNAANLLFVTFARLHGNVAGHVMAFMVMAVAAAEVAVGLSIVIVIFRSRGAADASELNLMKD